MVRCSRLVLQDAFLMVITGPRMVNGRVKRILNRVIFELTPLPRHSGDGQC